MCDRAGMASILAAGEITLLRTAWLLFHTDMHQSLLLSSSRHLLIWNTILPWQVCTRFICGQSKHSINDTSKWAVQEWSEQVFHNEIQIQLDSSTTPCRTGWAPRRIKIPRRKVWLMHTASVPCSNAANRGERKSWTQSEFCTWQNSLRQQQPRKCIYGVPAKDTAKHRKKFGWPPLSDVGAVMMTQNPLKFAGAPQICQPISAVVDRSSPCCQDMCRRYCCLTSFFSDCLNCKDIAWQSCAMVHRWHFFASCIFSETRPAHFTPAF